MKAFDTNSKEFVSLVKIIFPQEYMATDEDLADESVIQYLKEYYTEEHSTESESNWKSCKNERLIPILCSSSPRLKPS